MMANLQRVGGSGVCPVRDSRFNAHPCGPAWRWCRDGDQLQTPLLFSMENTISKCERVAQVDCQGNSAKLAVTNPGSDAESPST